MINFDKILEVREKINQVCEVIFNKINKLKNIYRLILDNHSSDDYVFGIDSFHFQNSLIEIEYLNLKNMFKMIDNRVYCEYYKLYNNN